MKFFLAFLAMITTAAAFASDVLLESNVFVERVKQDSLGKRSTVLEPPKVVTPGDKLVFVLSYKNSGAKPASDFVATSPVPSAVAYSDVEGEGAAVSVDGGQSWGNLAALKVKGADGAPRAAFPADVTHIRWSFAKAIPAGAGGKLIFKGVVR
jgi:uncharacterized repeat protein (TIGR01451 family)